MKTLVTAILLAALAISTPGCAMLQGPKDASSAQQAAHVAFGFAKAGLDYLKEESVRYMDGLQDPTPEDLDKASEMVQRLDRAKVALDLAEPYVMGEKSGDADMRGYILDAAESLKLVAEELQSHNVKIPGVILSGLDLAISWAKTS